MSKVTVFGAGAWGSTMAQVLCDAGNDVLLFPENVPRAFQVINATWGYAWRAWTLTLWGKNLRNEKYDQRVFFFGNEDPDYLEKRYEDRAAPRQIGRR